MVTIAFSVIVYVVAQSWTDLTRGPEGIKNIPGSPCSGPRSASSDLSPVRRRRHDVNGAVAYFWVVGVALLVQVLSINLLSAVGRTINAVRQSEIASETIGVSVYRWKVGAFALSAVLAGSVQGRSSLIRTATSSATRSPSTSRSSCWST